MPVIVKGLVTTAWGAHGLSLSHEISRFSMKRAFFQTSRFWKQCETTLAIADAKTSYQTKTQTKLLMPKT